MIHEILTSRDFKRLVRIFYLALGTFWVHFIILSE